MSQFCKCKMTSYLVLLRCIFLLNHAYNLLPSPLLIELLVGDLGIIFSCQILFGEELAGANRKKGKNTIVVRIL